MFDLQVELCFTKFISLYNKNEAEWKPLLTDLGKGKAPLEMLIEFEEGLRYVSLETIFFFYPNPNYHC